MSDPIMRRDLTAVRGQTPDFHSEGGNPMADLWLIVRRHRLLIAACGLGAVLAAVLVIRLSTPEYEATASIRVDQRQPELPALEVLRQTPANNITTEMEMLKARSLASAVVGSLGLRLKLLAPAGVTRGTIFSSIAVSESAEVGEYALVRGAGETFDLQRRAGGEALGRTRPGERLDAVGLSLQLNPAATQYTRIEFDVISSDAAVRDVSDGVEVSRSGRETEMLTLRYRGSDPELVRDVTNALAIQFIADRQQTRRTGTRSTADFIRSQISGVANRLNVAENALRQFREGAGVIDVQEQATTEVRRMAELLAQRNALDAERIALDGLLTQAEPRPSQAGDPDQPSSYRNLVAFPSLLRNQAVSTLISSLAQVEDRRADLLARRKPDDPDVLILTNRAAEIEEQLRTVASSYLQGMSNQVAAINGILAQSGHEMEKIPAKEMRFAQLQREVQGLEQVYEQLQMRLKEVEIAGAAEDGSIRLVDPAMLPSAPVHPRKSLILLLTTIVGLVGGVGLAFVRELMDGSVRTRGDAQLAVGMPVLALVPRMAGARRLPGTARQLLQGRSVSSPIQRHGLVPGKADTPYAADPYERLHTSIIFSRSDEEPRVLVFTSPLPGDGKTTSATNFARTLAQHGFRVVLVDADLRRGRVSSVFGVPRGLGLAEVLSGKATVNEVIHAATVSASGTLDFITTGTPPANPAQLLGSPEMAAFLDLLSQRYDRVIVDTSPLNVVSDAALLGPKADAVVMVARAGVTPVDALAYAAEQARNSGMPVIGTLLNDVDFERDAAYDTAYKWYAYGQAYYSSAAQG